MTQQLNIDYSRIARDKGIEKAEKSANELHENWSERAYWFFKYFVTHSEKPFKIEEFREWVAEMLPAPRSLRAFGGIAMRAAKEGLIKRVGFAQVDNVKAHRANCALWMKT
jgi:hypothetical protein